MEMFKGILDIDHFDDSKVALFDILSQTLITGNQQQV